MDVIPMIVLLGVAVASYVVGYVHAKSHHYWRGYLDGELDARTNLLYAGKISAEPIVDMEV